MEDNNGEDCNNDDRIAAMLIIIMSTNRIVKTVISKPASTPIYSTSIYTFALHLQRNLPFSNHTIFEAIFQFQPHLSPKKYIQEKIYPAETKQLNIYKDSCH